MKIGVLTSGGDAPGMNAAIRAVVRKALAQNCKVFGIKRGYSGLISGEIIPMHSRSVGDILQRGGTVLKSARCPEFKTPEGQAVAKEQLEKLGLNGLVILGGDGSFRGAQVLNKMGFKTVGIPATIDNDIGCTDYSIGYDTAVNTVLDAINKIRDTASSHNRVYVVEVMGKNSGFIAISAGLTGGAEAIMVPEIPYNLDEVCNRIKSSLKKGKTHSIIIVAEGLMGDPISVEHSSGFTVGKYIAEKTGADTRMTVLGHIQRGGTPSFFDRKIATLMGAKAVDLLLAGETERMVGFVNNRIEVFNMDDAINTKNRINMEELELANIMASV
ncbi:MAG TPA: 6-phosphofructokinase [Bacillota bacterium]|nr:6-phosphofructokinase [Bacillota bacterium]